MERGEKLLFISAGREICAWAVWWGMASAEIMSTATRKWKSVFFMFHPLIIAN
jgi:hypothetical protein